MASAIGCWRSRSGGFQSVGSSTTRPHCAEVAWPAKLLYSTWDRKTDWAGSVSWMGSLVQHGQDPSGHLSRRNRYYDPATGRFTQEDPIGLGGGVNLYGFAYGDPVGYGDPFGLAACFDSKGNKIPCAEPAGGPKVPLPRGRNQPAGVPNRWKPVPGGGRSTKWVPVYPVPSPGDRRQPGASWDPEGHWDVDGLPGAGGRKRYDDHGVEVDHNGQPVPQPAAPGPPQPSKFERAIEWLNDRLDDVKRAISELPSPVPLLPGGFPAPIPMVP